MNLEGTRQRFPAGTKLRPLRDRIVVKPIDWQPSKIIEVAGSKRRTLKGTVIAVGPGANVRKYDFRTLPDGRRERCGYRDYSQLVPMELKVGDVVELGGFEIDGYTFQEIYIGNEMHVICQQQDVAGVHHG